MIHLEETNVPDAEIKFDKDQLVLPTVSNDEVHEEKPNAPTMKRYANAIEDLVLPSFSATNSIISYADTTLTNILTSLLVPGAAKLNAHFHSVDRNNDPITPWKHVRDLGVHMSTDLKFNYYIYNVVRAPT